MADIRDVYYHGVRHQIRRVLTALGPERIEKGLTAFDDGESNWSECFFARALNGEADLSRCWKPEQKIMEVLNLPSHVPIRIVWNLFDQMSAWRNVQGPMLMDRKQFRLFIESVLDESRPKEVMALLRQLNKADLEKEVHCNA